MGQRPANVATKMALSVGTLCLSRLKLSHLKIVWKSNPTLTKILETYATERLF